jgi:phosphatidate cytidylyltransferase
MTSSAQGGPRRRHKQPPSPKHDSEYYKTDESDGDALQAATAAKQESSLRKFLTRVVVGFAMIGVFALIMYGGHLYAWVMVVVLQTLIFRELVNVRYKAAAEKNIPWFRSMQWLWFYVALFFNYGDSFGAFLETRKLRFVPPVLVHYLRYHTWVSFAMYTATFVMSVLSLKRGLYKYQMGQYTWTIVTIGMIVFQMKYVLTNIFNGLFWFVLPVSLVVCNDCFAFFCGKIAGKKFIKTPFLRLSPNKTWEGFIGAGLCTIAFGFFASAYLAKFQWMICPLESLQLIPETLTCTPPEFFTPQVYTLPALIAKYVGMKQVLLLPVQVRIRSLFLMDGEILTCD